jgi:S1-C subfamily serine protease
MNRYFFPIRSVCILVFLIFVLMDAGKLIAQGVDLVRLEEAKKNIVKITTTKKGDVGETGAGIIVKHIDKKALIIITAYHVVEKADKIAVSFYHDRTIPALANVYERYDEEKDFAVIYVPRIQNFEKLKPLEIVSDTTVHELDEVVTIGHPHGKDWIVSSGKIKKSDDILDFAYSSESIHKGNSGGGLFNDQFQLIGLVTQKGVVEGRALKVKYAVEMLINNNLPCDFILTERRKPIIPQAGGNKKWWILGTGVVVSTAAIITYFVLNIKQNGPDPLPGPPDPP